MQFWLISKHWCSYSKIYDLCMTFHTSALKWSLISDCVASCFVSEQSFNALKLTIHDCWLWSWSLNTSDEISLPILLRQRSVSRHTIFFQLRMGVIKKIPSTSVAKLKIWMVKILCVLFWCDNYHTFCWNRVLVFLTDWLLCTLMSRSINSVFMIPWQIFLLTSPTVIEWDHFL